MRRESRLIVVSVVARRRPRPRRARPAHERRRQQRDPVKRHRPIAPAADKFESCPIAPAADKLFESCPQTTTSSSVTVTVIYYKPLAAGIIAVGFLIT